MRVSGEEYLRVSQLRQGNRGADSPARGSISTAPARGSSAAREEISPEAQEIQKVAALVAREPEIRAEMVASLRERIEQGTYNVTGEQIGEMMLRRLLADRVR